MTTEAIEEATENASANRSISELLKLDAYDGLSDTEVRTLINYNVEQTLSSERLRGSQETNRAIYESIEEGMAAVCADSSQVLQSIINSTTNYQGVAPTAVTDLLTSLEEV